MYLEARLPQSKQSTPKCSGPTACTRVCSNPCGLPNRYGLGVWDDRLRRSLDRDIGTCLSGKGDVPAKAVWQNLISYVVRRHTTAVTVPCRRATAEPAAADAAWSR